MFAAGIIAFAPSTSYATTGNKIASGIFPTVSKSMWKGAQTVNLILEPNLPDLNTGDGKDVSKWKSNWNDVMVKSGWGSDHISGDDDALQVYATKAIDGSSTFAIRPAKSGTIGGGDACLGGAAADTKYDGGVSYTVELSSAERALANEGKLRTSSKAEFYRQRSWHYYFAVTVEFFDAKGTSIGTQRKTWTDKGAEDGYLSRGVSAVDVPSGTAYIRYWFSNNGTGNSRKAVKNMQAYLFDDSQHTNHDDIDFQPWNSADSLPENPGNYFLTSDVNISSAWSCPDEVNLCLNGYKIIQNSASNTINIGSGKTLTVYDCSEAGAITHSEGAVGKGVVVSGGVFNLYGGKIAGNGSITVSERGSGVFVSSGTFNMYGGEITENKTGDARGAGVSVGNLHTEDANATFNMYGGEIHGNTVAKARGSAVSVGGATTNGKYLFYFNMYGGKIYDNTSSGTNLSDGKGDADAVAVDKNGRFVMSGGEIVSNRNGVYVVAGVVTLSGTARITGNGKIDEVEKGGTYGYNLRLGFTEGESRYLTVGEGGFSEGAEIGVSIVSEHDDKISSGTYYINNPDYSDTSSLSYIYSEDSNKKFYYDSTSAAIKIIEGHSHGETEFAEWTYTALDDYVSEGEDYYYLSSDINATGDISFGSGCTVTLCLNGYNLNMGEYSIYNRGTLSICDCQKSIFEENGSVNGTQITVQNYGSLSIDGVSVASEGSSAVSNNSGASLTLSSGEITSTSEAAITNNGGTVEATEGVAVFGSSGDEIPPHEHEISEDSIEDCTKDVLCAVCNEVVTPGNADHAASDWIVDENLLTKYKECTECGMVLEKADVYEITVKAEGSGAVSGGGLVDAGGSIEIVAEAGNHYVFEGWYKDGALVGESEVFIVEKVTESATYTAKFTKQIPVLANENGDLVLKANGYDVENVKYVYIGSEEKTVKNWNQFMAAKDPESKLMYYSDVSDGINWTQYQTGYYATYIRSADGFKFYNVVYLESNYSKPYVSAEGNDLVIHNGGHTVENIKYIYIGDETKTITTWNGFAAAKVEGTKLKYANDVADGTVWTEYETGYYAFYIRTVERGVVYSIVYLESAYQIPYVSADGSALTINNGGYTVENIKYIYIGDELKTIATWNEFAAAKVEGTKLKYANDVADGTVWTAEQNGYYAFYIRTEEAGVIYCVVYAWNSEE